MNNILHLNLSDDPSSLDPRVVRSLKDLTVVKQLFEGLMRLDQNGIPRPAIAETIEISDDLLTYTFHLKQAYWSNRDRVTAYDFEYAWKKILENDFASDYAYMLYPIKNAQLVREGKCGRETVGVKALDDQTLVVHLHSPTPYFLELTAFPTYFPVNHKIDIQEKQWSAPPGNFFVCNGPFYLKKWIPQKEVILEKNFQYWDCEAVTLNGIAFSIITDNLTENYLFEKNELDWLGQPISHSISTELLHKLKGQKSLNSYTVAGTLWFEFNVNCTPFNNKKLRKAFAYAINRQEMISHILQGNQLPATGPLPPSMAVTDFPYFNDSDIEKAKELFNEVLLENRCTAKTFPTITLIYPFSERNLKIAQLVQQQWRLALGVEVELQSMENHIYKSRVKQGLYQIGIGQWIADFNDPLAFLELFKYRNDEKTGNGMNPTGWQNEKFIALLDQSLIESNSRQRGKLLQQAEQLLVDEMPIAPVYHYSFDYLKKPYVHNVFLSPLGMADFKCARITR